MLKRVARIVTFVVGCIMVLAFFFDVRFLSAAEAEIQDWGIIIAAFALVVASVNLIQVNLKKVLKGDPVDRICSILLLISLFSMGIIGITQGPTSETYQFLFNSVMAPGQSTVWAIGVFYIASAAYRAFRVRNADAGFLLFSAAFVMLAAVPIGEIIWNKIPYISDWIYEVPNMAGMRGMLIGAGVGAFSGSLRVLLGIERTYSG